MKNVVKLGWRLKLTPTHLVIAKLPCASPLGHAPTSSRPLGLKTVSPRADRLTPPGNSVRISPRVTSTSALWRVLAVRRCLRRAHGDSKHLCVGSPIYLCRLKRRTGKPGGPRGAQDVRAACFTGRRATQQFTRTAFARGCVQVSLSFHALLKVWGWESAQIRLTNSNKLVPGGCGIHRTAFENSPIYSWPRSSSEGWSFFLFLSLRESSHSLDV